MYTVHVHFQQISTFCIDNARIIYRKIRYKKISFKSTVNSALILTSYSYLLTGSVTRPRLTNTRIEEIIFTIPRDRVIMGGVIGFIGRFNTLFVTAIYKSLSRTEEFSITVFSALPGNFFQQQTFLCSRAGWRPSHTNLYFSSYRLRTLLTLSAGPSYTSTASLLSSQKTPLPTYFYCCVRVHCSNRDTAP
jgi:hypothetical protein